MNRARQSYSLEDELSSVEEEIDDLLEDADDLEEGTDEYEEMEVEYKALCIQRDNYEEYCEEMDDPTFELKELSFGELMHVRDDVMSVSDRDNPREGLYQVKVLETAVEESPDEMSDDPSEWNPQLAELVYEKVDEINTGVSEDALGNYSLGDALESR